MRRHWLRWKAERLFARLFLFPLILLMTPFTALEHWLGKLYYKLR